MAGLLGAATVNPLMARQFANARQNVTAPTSVMDERYPAWKKSQDQATQFLLAADLIGSAVPAGLLAAPAMKKGLLSMGETVAPKMENYMARQGLLQPITAYHGSPHRFDKFDASKIGTGEGAQAYGHGVYLAQSPEVAKSYMRTQINNAPELEQMALRAGASPDAANTIAQWYHNTKNKSFDEFLKIANEPAPHPHIQKFRDSLRQQEPSLRKAWESFTDKGNLYTVDLPDPMIAKMLDWDKPLSQQAPEVQKALHKAGLVDFEKNIGPSAAGEIRDLGWTKNVSSLGGEDLYRRLVERQFMNKGSISTSSRKLSESEVSELLREQGIPGIRYLDGGSRGTGAGTSNFVVFPGNEQLVKILSRE